MAPENLHEESLSGDEKEESGQEDQEKEDRSQDVSKEVGDRETRAEVDEADNEKEGRQEENICRESGPQATVSHRAKLRGMTLVIKSLIPDPSVRKRSFRDRVAAPT